MDKLKETVYIDIGSVESIPVGTVSDYIDISDTAAGALLYQRLNRKRGIRPIISIAECTKYAKELLPTVPGSIMSDEFVETVIVPFDDFFEDMDVLEMGIETGPFIDECEYISESPLVKINHHGKEVTVAISDKHKDKPISQQKKIAKYAIHWKMKLAKKMTNLAENDLKQPLNTLEITEMNTYLKSIRSQGIDCPRGVISPKVPVIITGFKKHAERRLNERDVTAECAQAWIDSSIIMLNQHNDETQLYIAFDGSVAVEVEHDKVRTIYPSTAYGKGSRMLMQKAISIIKKRNQ